MRSLILFMIAHIHGGKITKITCFPLELCGKYETWTYQTIISFLSESVENTFRIPCSQTKDSFIAFNHSLQYCYLCNMHYCLPHRHYTRVLNVL